MIDGTPNGQNIGQPEDLLAVDKSLHAILNHTISYRKNWAELNSKRYLRFCDLLDKYSYISLGSIPLSFTLIGPLLEHNLPGVKKFFLILIFGWLALIISALLNNLIKYILGEEQHRIDSAHLQLESKIIHINNSSTSLRQKLEQHVQLSENLDEYTILPKFPMGAYILSSIFFVLGLNLLFLYLSIVVSTVTV